MPLIAFSPRKALVLYGMIGHSDAKALLAKLGKHTTGKGCLRSQYWESGILREFFGPT